MNPITHGQAATLRLLRPDVKQLEQLVDDFAGSLAMACGHNGIDKTCRICRLWKLISRVERLIDPPGGGSQNGGLADLIDEALTSGPNP